MILRGFMFTEHFTELHLDKWMCCTAHLLHLEVPRHFEQANFLFFILHFLHSWGSWEKKDKSGKQNKRARTEHVRGDEWQSEGLWFDMKLMRFDWTGGGELIDSKRLWVEAQEVCVWVEEVLPAILYAAELHSFTPLTLFDCVKGMEEKQEVLLAFSKICPFIL